jgi:hypothetical protein
MLALAFRPKSELISWCCDNMVYRTMKSWLVSFLLFFLFSWTHNNRLNWQAVGSNPPPSQAQEQRTHKRTCTYSQEGLKPGTFLVPSRSNYHWAITWGAILCVSWRSKIHLNLDFKHKSSNNFIQSFTTKEKLPFKEVEIAAMAPNFIVFLMSPRHHLELVVFAPPYMLKPKIIHECLLS